MACMHDGTCRHVHIPTDRMRPKACCVSLQGTYYGDNGWAGWCAGNVPNEGKPWPPAGGQYGTLVALNLPQFDNGAHCGRKLMYRGLNPDCTTCGGSPVTTDWKPAQVTNLCPECKFGDLDQGIGGDGRCIPLSALHLCLLVHLLLLVY